MRREKREMMLKTKGPLRKYGPWLLLAVLAAALVPLLLLGGYAHPAADDYSYGLFTHTALQQGTSLLGAVWRTVKGYYTGWQGTYSAIAMMTLTPGIWGEQFYWLTPVVMIGAVAVGTFKLTDTLLRRMGGCSWRAVLAAGCAMTLLAVELVPYPLHSFYWWNGAVYYTFTYGLMLLWADRLLVLRLEKSVRQAVWPLVSALLLSVFLGGSNYVSGLFAAVLGAVFCLFCLIRQRNKLPAALVIEIVLGGCFVFSMIAPGNAVRQSGLEGYSAINSVAWAVLKAGRDCFRFLSPVLAAALLLAVPFLYHLAGKTKFKFRFPLLFLVFAFLVFATQNAPHYYAAGTAGPERLRNIVFYAYLWLLPICEFYVLGWVRRRFAPHEWLKARAGQVAVGCLTALLVISCVGMGVQGRLSSTEAVRELTSGEAAAYDAEMNARYSLYHDPARPDVTVEPVKARPKLLYWNDITPSMYDWTNQAVSNYYGKTSIVLAEAKD